MRREKLIQTALIICPTSLKYQWKREIERFTGQPREEEIVTETPETDIPAEEQPAQPSDIKVHTNPKDLITQGASFLSGLAATLKSPEATQQLVDTLVHTDKETGRTTLNIPVPDKQSVKNILDLVGKLFG